MKWVFFFNKAESRVYICNCDLNNSWAFAPPLIDLIVICLLLIPIRIYRCLRRLNREAILFLPCLLGHSGRVGVHTIWYCGNVILRSVCVIWNSSIGFYLDVVFFFNPHVVLASGASIAQEPFNQAIQRHNTFTWL